MKLQEWLSASGACQEAMAWVGDRTPREAWDECSHADWLVWAAGRLGVPLDARIDVMCRCSTRGISNTQAGADLARAIITIDWAGVAIGEHGGTNDGAGTPGQDIKP